MMKRYLERIRIVSLLTVLVSVTGIAVACNAPRDIATEVMDIMAEGAQPIADANATALAIEAALLETMEAVTPEAASAMQTAMPGTVSAVPLYMDAAAPIDDRVEDLLSRMTLAEKIGQMTQVEKGSIDPDEVGPAGIGSVLSGGGGSPARNNPEEWANMVRAYQEGALSSRLGIPLLYGFDAVHGAAAVDGATIFPHNIGLGATGDPELVQQTARATALESTALGIRWNFAPVLAVPQDIRWGRTYEAFGDDTALVTELGAAYQRGLQDAGDGAGLANPTTMLATPKHFIGDGATTWGTSTQNIMDVPYQLDQGDMQLDEATVRELLLPPYEQAVAEGARSVMASFNSWNGDKVHGREDVLTGMLKDELGFEGFIVSDWGGCDQIDADYYTAIVACVNAGVDMNMVPYDFETFIATLTEAVESGDVPMERIDDAARRILRVKFEMGLFEEPFADADALSLVGAAEHRALAREAVRRSLVLLQNEGDVLPIARADTELIFVAGEFADDAGAQSGGWTTQWQGVTGTNFAGSTTILEGLEAAAGENTRVQFNRFGNFDRILDETGNPATADVGIVVVGETPYAEGVGDRADLTLTPEQVGLIERVAQRSEQVVVVLLSGRPLVIPPEALPIADAWVAAWWPGSEGAGVADVVFGDFPFTGRLSYDWPRSMDDVPGGGALFPRGFGLTTQEN